MKIPCWFDSEEKGQAIHLIEMGFQPTHIPTIDDEEYESVEGWLLCWVDVDGKPKLKSKRSQDPFYYVSVVVVAILKESRFELKFSEIFSDFDEACESWEYASSICELACENLTILISQQVEKREVNLLQLPLF